MRGQGFHEGVDGLKSLVIPTLDQRSSKPVHNGNINFYCILS